MPLNRNDVGWPPLTYQTRLYVKNYSKLDTYFQKMVTNFRYLP